MMSRFVCGLTVAVLSVSVVGGLAAQTRKPVRKVPPRPVPGKTRTVPGKKPAVPNAKMLSELYDKQREAERADEVKRINRDLAYWNRILAGKPSAEGRQRALFHAGEALQRAKRWEAADKSFESLISEFPQSPWAMPARCRRIDITLEYRFDFPGADADAKVLVLWSRALDAKYFSGLRPAPPQKRSGTREPVEARKPLIPPIPEPKIVYDKAATPSIVYPVPSERQQLRDVLRRVGVVHGVHSRLGQTTAALLRAQILRGRSTERIASDESAEHRMLSAAKSRSGLVSLKLWTSKKDMFSYLVYSAHLLNSRDFDRPRNYISALLRNKKLDFTDFQKSYLHFLLGQSYNGHPDRKERQKGVGEFLIAQKLAPESFWADQALFLAANAAWNHSQDAGTAVRLWQQLRKEYPKSIVADRSIYYIGVVYENTKRYGEAKEAFESLLRDRPESSYAKLTKEKLKNVNRELSRSGMR